ncbi:MAG TPA: hypothetical protein VGI12_07705 [Vicinamibacterales bacterium]|jgi:hypothetical protein
MAVSSPAPAAAPIRPRPVLLGLLAAALVGLIAYLLWPAAATRPAASNPPREQRRQASPQQETAATGPLSVRIDALKQTPAAPEEKGRNPFRFYVPPPPPPPPAPAPPSLGPTGSGGTTMNPAGPPQPMGPPPIPLKFIGKVEVKGRTVAIFTPTDKHGMPVYAGEGELVLGQYRVVKIGVESVTLEYLDGTGRQTIPMRG